MSDTEERREPASPSASPIELADAERVPLAAAARAAVLVAACHRPSAADDGSRASSTSSTTRSTASRAACRARLRIAVDWIVTIVGAVAIVLAIKAWVVNPYRIPSSSMEPTLHCARPAPGCESRFSDRVLANRFIYHFRDPQRGDIVVFETPPAAKAKCGAGGTFVKRIIGLPGERCRIRLRRGAAFVYIDGKRLEEPYIENDRRDIGPEETFRVPQGHYFVMGDNRSQSCDSRVWGSVPEDEPHRARSS